jgi:hypothetical protein
MENCKNESQKTAAKSKSPGPLFNYYLLEKKITVDIKLSFSLIIKSLKFYLIIIVVVFVFSYELRHAHKTGTIF